MSSPEIQTRRRLRHRVVEGAIVSCLVVVALALAFLTRDGALAQEAQVKSAKAWDGNVVSSPPPEWERMLSAAPDQKIRFENAAGAPIVITDANVKVMKFDVAALARVGPPLFLLDLLAPRTAP